MQVAEELQPCLHPVSSGPAAGQPGLPAGRTAAQLYECDSEEGRRQAVEGDKKWSESSPFGPLSEHTGIVPAVQRVKVVITSAHALSFLPFFILHSLNFFLYCEVYWD